MLRNDIPRRALSAGGIVLVATAPGIVAGSEANAFQSFDYHESNILGTDLSLTVVAANRTDADAAEAAVLAEIRRLSKILSSRDATSELARLNALPVNAPAMKASPELIDVLTQYDTWQRKSEGAFNGHAGELLAMWDRAETAHHLPSDADLQAAADRAAKPAWKIDASAGTVQRISDQQINVDSLGKGYIIDHAVAAATRDQSRLHGLLLNIGGDLRTWGSPAGPAGAPWSIGIQDPAHPELNAKPLTTIYVPGNRSVSSSGAYQRFYTIDGKRYSHILDARTGKAGRNPAATVVADSSTTANALANICCSMKFAEGMALVRATPNADAMIINADGLPIRTDGFKDLQNQSLAAANAAPKAAVQFPAGYKLTIDLQTAQTQRKPYVFAWVTDADDKYVKTLAAYGNESRYLHDMREWWKFAQGDRSLQSMTHATQRAGSYPLAWDGTDQRGSGVPLGKYTIWIEVASEHGPYAAKYGSITLGSQPADAKITASAAFADVNIHYGPGAK